MPAMGKFQVLRFLPDLWGMDCLSVSVLRWLPNVTHLRTVYFVC